MRNLRKTLAIGLPILGTVLVFLAILMPSIALNLRLQILVVLIGLLIIEAGVWRLTAKVLPSERKFLALRMEVDGFIDRIRVLNAYAVNLRQSYSDTTREAFRETVDALHAAVDRMAEVAGKEV
ncbi:MAG: hypothetical protein ACWGSQ_02300 [Longimicrobiales bacterium]